MMFGRAFSFVSLLTIFLTFSFVATNPLTFGERGSDVAVEKRQSNADIQAVLSDLQSQVRAILPQIDALAASGDASDDNVTPLINQLTAALDSSNVRFSRILLKHRIADKEIAKVIAVIIRDITISLNGLFIHRARIRTLGALLVAVDVSLHKVLLGLDVLLLGVLKLVGALLFDVAVALKTLTFSLTLAALGL